MSEKVANNKFKSEIDRMVEQGQSSRAISSWLSQRGESISHVTIAAYRNSEKECITTIPPIDYESAEEAKEKLTEIILQKAIESPNNPTKLRAYVDAYLKLSNQIEKDKESSVSSSVEEFKYLSQEEKLEKIKGHVLTNLSYFHSYNQVQLDELTPDLQDEFNSWKKNVELVLTPIFNGKLPEVVKC